MIYFSPLGPEEALQPAVNHRPSALCVPRFINVDLCRREKIESTRNQEEKQPGLLVTGSCRHHWRLNWQRFISLRVAECLSTPTLQMETIEWTAEHRHGSSGTFSKKYNFIKVLAEP